jgi:pimeloyl-ACP methyl ester carboxylesterase
MPAGKITDQEYNFHKIHEPPNPSVDIVFIHGLGGGSRHTWGRHPAADNDGGPSPDSDDEAPFWPGEFLAKDDDFELNTAISTYGYPSRWTTPEDSFSNVEDFANNLLVDLHDDQRIRESNTGIILVGHSMGGLVAKQVYVSARTLKGDLADRIYAIFFLGTPHKGAKLAASLNFILRLFRVRKPFVDDLIPNSRELQRLYNAFLNVACKNEGLYIHTILESRKLRLFGPIGALVVDKESAVLHWPNETRYEFNKDHRELCKFRDQEDPDYRALRRALRRTVEEIRKARRFCFYLFLFHFISFFSNKKKGKKKFLSVR